MTWEEDVPIALSRTGYLIGLYYFFLSVSFRSRPMYLLSRTVAPLKAPLSTYHHFSLVHGTRKPLTTILTKLYAGPVTLFTEAIV